MNPRTRLTFPAGFRRERSARDVVETYSLWNIGAQIVEVSPGRFAIVIDTYKPDTVCRFLGLNMPGCEWGRSELP